MRFTLSTVLTILALSVTALAKGEFEPGDYLVKLKSPHARSATLSSLAQQGVKLQKLSLEGWVRVKIPAEKLGTFNFTALEQSPEILYVQPNYKISLKNTFRPAERGFLSRAVAALSMHPTRDFFTQPPADNPAIPPVPASTSGADPDFSKQWGMQDAGVTNGWKISKGSKDMVVAVIDTGVDYTHEDLVENMWRNPGETGKDAQGRDKSTNGVDDDGNGYVDDVMGWDFVDKDNKPFDNAGSIMEILFQGANPGHGTHCAGNVAARSDNGKGIAGVAPRVKIMALRFISKEGQGTTADAVEAINYAIKMGAKVTSNSWGSEGEDPGESNENKMLRDAIAASEKAGVLFVAAAGNGHQGKGYDNDTDAKPGYPASYADDIIISVAALDVSGQLGAFSNWGRNSVDIGAPGVKVYSTVPGSLYEDTLVEGMATWDGTSMATPHVAGAAALYWSMHPEKTWKDVKNALMASAKPTSSMSGKSTSGGRLDVDALMTKY